MKNKMLKAYICLHTNDMSWFTFHFLFFIKPFSRRCYVSFENNFLKIIFELDVVSLINIVLKMV